MPIRRTPRHGLPKGDWIGRYPVDTVWFSLHSNAWLRRTAPTRNEIVATDEFVWNLFGRYRKKLSGHNQL